MQKNFIEQYRFMPGGGEIHFGKLAIFGHRRTQCDGQRCQVKLREFLQSLHLQLRPLKILLHHPGNRAKSSGITHGGS
jgi:hypothetical protein